MNLADLSKPLDEDNIKVTMHDFIQALNEVKPAFGAAINSLEMCRYESPAVADVVASVAYMIYTWVLKFKMAIICTIRVALLMYESCDRLNGMLDCGDSHAHILRTAKTFVEQVKKSERTPLLTCLLEGPSGTYVFELPCKFIKLHVDNYSPILVQETDRLGFILCVTCTSVIKMTSCPSVVIASCCSLWMYCFVTCICFTPC